MTEQNAVALRYGEYLRKSTDDKEKQVLSLESQRDVIDRQVKANGLAVKTTIIEKFTAKKPGRPGFSQLVRDIKSGKINAIVTWAPHRLSRNPVDAGELINLFDTGHLKEVVTENQTFRNTPMDKFMLNFLCLTAKLENDNKAIDVAGGLRKSASKGTYPSCPPLGYLPDQHGIKGARRRDIDPVFFPIIRRMWDYMLTGHYTPRQILLIATNEWGLRSRRGSKLSVSAMYKILNNPFYYGEYEWPRKSGNWFTGVHRPMISKEEFNKVQFMLERPSRARPIRNYFPFAGCTLHCGYCGCAITASKKVKRQKNGNVHEYEYYHCVKKKLHVKCPGTSVSGYELAVQIQEVLQEIHIPREIHECLMEVTEFENQRALGQTCAEHEANKKAYEALLRKRDGLIDMRASGDISDEVYRSKHEKVDAEMNRLKAIIEETEYTVINWLKVADRMYTFAELAIDRFKNGTPELKRAILMSLGWNLCVTGKNLDLSRENWIKPVIELAKYIQSQNTRMEPVLTLQDKVKIRSCFDKNVLCSLVQDVRTCFINSLEKPWFAVVDKWA